MVTVNHNNGQHIKTAIANNQVILHEKFCMSKTMKL